MNLDALPLEYAHCGRIPQQKRLTGKGFILPHSLRLQSTMVEKSQGEELEASGHTASAARKENSECLCSAYILFLVQPGIPAQGMRLSKVGGCLSYLSLAVTKHHDFHKRKCLTGWCDSHL